MIYPFRLPFRHPFRSAFKTPGFGEPLPCFNEVLAWHKGLVQDDIYLKDSATALGDYQLQMVDGPALKFNGVDQYGTFDAVTLVGDFEATVPLIISLWTGFETLLAGNNNVEGEFRLGLGTNVIQITYAGMSRTFSFSSSFTLGIAETIRLTREGTTLSCNRSSDNETVSIIGAGTEDVTFRQLGALVNLTRLFNGNFWNIRLKDATQDIHWPCIGRTATVKPETIFSADGTPMTLVGDLDEIHSGVQQSYFFEVSK